MGLKKQRGLLSELGWSSASASQCALLSGGVVLAGLWDCILSLVTPAFILLLESIWTVAGTKSPII